MGRHGNHETDPIQRFVWVTEQRKKAGEIDQSLERLLVSLAEDLDSTLPPDPLLRASGQRYLDLYARLEDAGTKDLLTHVRGVSQLVALEKAIRRGVEKWKPVGGQAARPALWQSKAKSDDAA